MIEKPIATSYAEAKRIVDDALAVRDETDVQPAHPADADEHLVAAVGQELPEQAAVDEPRDHLLDSEEYEIAPDAAAAINQALATGRRVVCVGTTACRALEHAISAGACRVRPGRWMADVFLVPGSVLRGTGAEMVPVPEMEVFAERFGFVFKAHEKGDANRSAHAER